MRGVRIHPETGKRRIVALPDDPVEFDAYLKRDRYERVLDHSERETVRAAVCTRNCTSPDYYIYLPEHYFGRTALCFGAVLLWSTDRDLTIDDSVYYGVFPAESELFDRTYRPGVLTQQFRCYQCHIPVTQYREGVPWCDNGHAAVPPGISVEEHVKRDYLNQFRRDRVIYPAKLAEEWNKPFTPADVNMKKESDNGNA